MKSLFVSKTFWFAILKVVFGGVGYFTGWVDPQVAWGLVLLGLADIGLRVKTTQPVNL